MTDIIKPFPKLDKITPIPIPFSEVPYLLTANIYALGQEEITLIDAGPGIPGALECIKKSFIKEGLDFNSINRIILTHGHMDHFGLAASIIEEVDHPVGVFIHLKDRWRISTEFLKNEIWLDELDGLQKIAGIPDNELNIIKKNMKKYYKIARPLDDLIIMEDDDIFYGNGYSLQVIHSPGHSPGLCCLFEPNRKVLFSSDHILKKITPKPILAFGRDKLPDKEYNGLIAYMDSLERVLNLDVKYLLPGHGEWIEDMQPVINQYRLLYSERMELVWNAVRHRELPVYYLIKDIFPNIEKSGLFIALSEIIAHLDALVFLGRIEILSPGPPVIYRAIK